MTLIAGLKCTDSLVFVSDSEESGGIRKTNVLKMRRVPEEGILGVLGHDPKKYTSIIVSGAGNGPLCDYAMQEITQKVRYTNTRIGAIAAIQEVVTRIWRDHVPLYPADRDDANFALLIGIKAPDWFEPTMYSVEGTTIVEREKWFSFGSGSVTDYILDQMYSERMSTEDGIAASLYMLQIAKKYVSGVSGTSHVYILKSDGTVDDKPPWEVTAEENIAQSFTAASGTLLLSLLRTRSSPEANFKNHLKAFNEAIRGLRKRKKESDKFLDNIMRRMQEREKLEQEKSATQSSVQMSEPKQ